MKKLQSTDPKKKKKKDLEKGRDDIEKYIKKKKELQKRYPNFMTRFNSNKEKRL